MAHQHIIGYLVPGRQLYTEYVCIFIVSLKTMHNKLHR